MFPGFQPRDATVKNLQVNTTSYSPDASVNIYEWLYEGSSDDIAADFDIDLRTADNVSTASTVRISRDQTTMLALVEPTYDVEQMSLAELTSFLNKYLSDFTALPAVELRLAALQGQPSLHRPLYDPSSSNYQRIKHYVMGHALFRTIYSRDIPDLSPNLTFDPRMQALFPDYDSAKSWNPMDYLALLFHQNHDGFSSAVILAEVDLAFQVFAPSIYLDPLKICAIIQAPATPEI
ncbi:hypothetical protein ATCC90586_001582 [Pythium insidiosum]|nr:hypothetical protein ATCC90586_001582 [Pythium insidiosum]